jgi:hypothetical protein
MKSELQKKLFDKYKVFFEYLEKHDSPMILPMQFGIECGDGWYTILDILMKNMLNHKENYNPQMEINVTQIKEKLGRLTFYYTGGDDIIKGMVRLAGSLSYNICEECGTFNNVGMTEGWYAVRCQSCYDKNDRLKDLKFVLNK